MTDATGAKQASESAIAANSPAGSPSKARRRLILAAGAVLPTVYTLSSGAQVAAASSMVCLAREGPPPPRFLENDDYARLPDGWVRSPVTPGEYDGTLADCVMTPQSGCAEWTPPPTSAKSSAPPTPGGHGTNAENGSVWVVRGNRMVSGPHTPITNVNPGRKHYGLVYVNQEGTVATLDPNGATDLHPTTTSCWTSIMGGRISKLG